MYVRAAFLDIGGWAQWIVDHWSGILALAFALAFIYFFLALGLGWPLPFESRGEMEDDEEGDAGRLD